MAVSGLGKILVFDFDSVGNQRYSLQLDTPLLPDTKFTTSWLPGSWYNRLVVTTEDRVQLLGLDFTATAGGGTKLCSFYLEEDSISASTFSKTEVFVITVGGRLYRHSIPIDMKGEFKLSAQIQVNRKTKLKISC